MWYLMTIKRTFECKSCGWHGRLEFNTYRESEWKKVCPKCSEENLEEIQEMGKYGTEKHIQLIKKALLVVVDKYYVKHSKISIENHKMSLNVGSRGSDNYGVYANKDFFPDICIEIVDVSDDWIMSGEKKYKKIFVECETTLDNLLRDEERLTAYKLLKIQNPDIMLYLVLPSKFKGKAKKPDFFNDIWYFDVEEPNTKNSIPPSAKAEGILEGDL